MEKTGDVNHNHCAKADPLDPIPFCYTTDPNVRFDYCDCEDQAMSDRQSREFGNGYVGNGGGNGGYYGGGYGGGYVGYNSYPGPKFVRRQRCKVLTTVGGNVMQQKL